MTSQRTRERLAARLGDSGISNVHVLNVIRQLPRHRFVDEALASRAYEDTALPIGHGQTISQPFVVARMTEIILRGGFPTHVLEIGTGCGYQAAVLAALCERVYTIERIRELHDRSRSVFRELGFQNIRQRFGDGFQGWPAAAPFDAIILTAAPSAIPAALLDQLKEGGRLLAPVGDANAQSLQLFTREAEQFHKQNIEAVNFVPMLEGVES